MLKSLGEGCSRPCSKVGVAAQTREGISGHQTTGEVSSLVGLTHTTSLRVPNTKDHERRVPGTS